ncbi:hypothetical protein BGZ74_000941 [Mortierella antarctica]|nr:hypothetical protein BGZ74_000941 [Mortierella antarctica]
MLRIVTTSAVRTLRPIQASSVLARRAYAENAFKDKERAAEEVYIRTKEAEQQKILKSLKAQIAQADKELEALKKAPQKKK